MIVVQHTRFPSRIGTDILQNDDSFKGSVIQAKAQIIRLSGIGTEKRLCKEKKRFFPFFLFTEIFVGDILNI